MGAAIQLNLLEATGEALPERVAEWIMPRASGDWLARSMPLLGELEGEVPERWLTWVRPGAGPLLAGPASRSHARGWRQVLATNRSDVIDCARRALAAGTSHTVVVLLDRALDAGTMQLLESAARAGHCFCLLLRRQ